MWPKLKFEDLTPPQFAAMNLYQARPLTPEVRIEQQAVSLLNVWFAKPLSKAEILE